MSRKELEGCMKDIQKYIEDTRTPKERNNLLKRKIVHLGATVKKTTLNFKHIKMLKEHKKIKKENNQEKLRAAGVFKKHKKRRN
ncbi:uncharacterized protein VNE69_07257 [Vairimorpha necatrix]|uniref:Uncharacterized protein n=1 Tax=Vairimorpha necatrix TaxID=6039 RepID=A0AAX4JEJ1_9MICR